MVNRFKRFSAAALLTLSLLAAPMLAHDASALALLQSQTCADMVAPSTVGECKGKGANCCPAVGATQQCSQYGGKGGGAGCGTCEGKAGDTTGIWKVVAGACPDKPTSITPTAY
jgi:aconitase A